MASEMLHQLLPWRSRMRIDKAGRIDLEFEPPGRAITQRRHAPYRTRGTNHDRHLPKLLPAGWTGGLTLLAMIFCMSAFLDNIAGAVIGGIVARRRLRLSSPRLRGWRRRLDGVVWLIRWRGAHRPVPRGTLTIGLDARRLARRVRLLDRVPCDACAAWLLSRGTRVRSLTKRKLALLIDVKFISTAVSANIGCAPRQVVAFRPKLGIAIHFV